MKCKDCKHGILEHFFGKCEAKVDGKRCGCVMTCQACKHGTYEHFLGFCSVVGCSCIAGHLVKESKSKDDHGIPDVVVVGSMRKVRASHGHELGK